MSATCIEVLVKNAADFGDNTPPVGPILGTPAPLPKWWTDLANGQAALPY